MHYLDTSVLASFYYPEANSPAVQRALGRVEDHAISPLVRTELFSALARRVRTKECPLDVARQIGDLFRQHLRQGRYSLIPVMSDDYQLAEDWLARFDTSLRTLDAIHLAVVYHGGHTLLTSDRILAASARKIGVPVRRI